MLERCAKVQKAVGHVCLVIFAKPSDCSFKCTWYRLPQTLYHFEKITEYHLKNKLHVFFGALFKKKSILNVINVMKL